MSKYTDMVGRAVGMWAVLSKDPTKPKRAYWMCRCLGCGVTQSVSGTHLRENIKGGCRACRQSTFASKHPAEHQTWQNIKIRAFNVNRRDSERYNALGMYEPWKKDFELFFHAVGPRPSPEHSIDRIDNDKGYFPGNVRWATRGEQARNTRRNLIIDGQVLWDYAQKVSTPYNTLRDRFHKGQL